MNKDDQLQVISFEPHSVQIAIYNFDKWKQNNEDSQIKIGSFLKVMDGNDNSVVVIVKSFKMFEQQSLVATSGEYSGSFLIETQPIGQLLFKDNSTEFIKGIRSISIPPNGVSLMSDQELVTVFSSGNSQNITFSDLLINNSISINVDGNKFFSKHIAVVGSTGSGKSCTVAKIIQEARDKELLDTNNTHVIVFDIHGEYTKAFPEDNHLSIQDKTLQLPYWLMNSEELEDMFIENSESNVHNQLSQFKHAVIENKKKHNKDLSITYDSSVYFSLSEVKNYLTNKNNETHYMKNEKTYYATLEEEKEVTDIHDLWEEIKFEKSTSNSAHKTFGVKVSKTDFNDNFSRLLSRLETKINDTRLKFLLSEFKTEEQKYSSDDLIEVLKNITGYNKKSNITIIDLSSLPFEVVSIVVSVISRLLFDYSYHKTKLRGSNPAPFMLVYEEAHKYIPKAAESKYKNTRIAVERIAKEGRKYGISSMIVSQRPSELSPTVFSQCNNFVIMRLNNPEDQQFVKRLLPDSVIGYGDALASLEQREALLVGDALKTPCIAKIRSASPTPFSDDVEFYNIWKSPWYDVAFEEIAKRIR